MLRTIIVALSLGICAAASAQPMTFKAGDQYYGFGRLEDTAQSTEFEFSK